MDNNIPIARPVEEPQQPRAPSASGRALASLILGILSLVCMGFLAGIPAIILGSMELKAIKRGESPRAGETLAKVGYILGIVSVVLTCLAMAAIAALIALGISLENIGTFTNTV